MELGIKGHPTRGNEVIKLLEMLGGSNCCNLKGIYDDKFYYIGSEYKYICNSFIGPDEIKGYEIYSLEDFLEKFPYRVGDKVSLDNKLCSIIWMCWECNNIYYQVQGEDLMFTKKVIANELKPYKEKKMNQMSLANEDEEEQIDPTNDYAEILKSMSEETEKIRNEFILKTLYTAGKTHDFLKERGFNLPDGYHFTDENGNVIDVKKIQLVKNPPYYPKTYDECCDVLKIPNDERYIDIDIPIGYNKLLGSFTELLICRDAYWKIAGDWEEKRKEKAMHYVICSTLLSEVVKDSTTNCIANYLLDFPTEEMRNAFYDNFKDLIEICKSLL